MLQQCPACCILAAHLGRQAMARCARLVQATHATVLQRSSSRTKTMLEANCFVLKTATGCRRRAGRQRRPAVARVHLLQRGGAKGGHRDALDIRPGGRTCPAAARAAAGAHALQRAVPDRRQLPRLGGRVGGQQQHAGKRRTRWEPRGRPSRVKVPSSGCGLTLAVRGGTSYWAVP